MWLIYFRILEHVLFNNVLKLGNKVNRWKSSSGKEMTSNIDTKNKGPNQLCNTCSEYTYILQKRDTSLINCYFSVCQFQQRCPMIDPLKQSE
jgi:hypothetical protein